MHRWRFDQDSTRQRQSSCNRPAVNAHATDGVVVYVRWTDPANIRRLLNSHACIEESCLEALRRWSERDLSIIDLAIYHYLEAIPSPGLNAFQSPHTQDFSGFTHPKSRSEPPPGTSTKPRHELPDVRAGGGSTHLFSSLKSWKRRIKCTWLTSSGRHRMQDHRRIAGRPSCTRILPLF